MRRALLRVARPLVSRRLFGYLERTDQGQALFWGGATVLFDNDKAVWLADDFRDRFQGTYETIIQRHYQSIERSQPRASMLERMIYLELKHRLPELLLMRVDKMTMANSVEARVPFLDQELISFALAIPDGLKIVGETTKAILRKAASGIVPNFVIDKPKMGFCGSASNMVRGEVFEYARDRIMSSSWMRGRFNVRFLERVFQEHSGGSVDHGMAIWCLLNLVSWKERWIDS